MLSPRHAIVSRKFPEQGCEIFGIDARPARIHYKVMKPFSWAFCLLPVHIYVSDSLQGNETFFLGVLFASSAHLRFGFITR